MESLAWVAHMELGWEEGGGQLPYLSYKGMFNVKGLWFLSPFGLKLGIEVQVMHPTT